MKDCCPTTHLYIYIYTHTHTHTNITVRKKNKIEPSGLDRVYKETQQIFFVVKLIKYMRKKT